MPAEGMRVLPHDSPIEGFTVTSAASVLIRRPLSRNLGCSIVAACPPHHQFEAMKALEPAMEPAVWLDMVLRCSANLPDSPMAVLDGLRRTFPLFRRPARCSSRQPCRTVTTSPTSAAGQSLRCWRCPSGWSKWRGTFCRCLTSSSRSAPCRFESCNVGSCLNLHRLSPRRARRDRARPRPRAPDKGPARASKAPIAGALSFLRCGQGASHVSMNFFPGCRDEPESAVPPVAPLDSRRVLASRRPRSWLDGMARRCQSRLTPHPRFDQRTPPRG